MPLVGHWENWNQLELRFWLVIFFASFVDNDEVMFDFFYADGTASFWKGQLLKRERSEKGGEKEKNAATLKKLQRFIIFWWWCHQESNRGHKDFQSFALPTELWHQGCKSKGKGSVVVPPGIEPGTQGFSVLCSTNWAMAPRGVHLLLICGCKVRK